MEIIPLNKKVDENIECIYQVTHPDTKTLFFVMKGGKIFSIADDLSIRQDAKHHFILVLDKAIFDRRAAIESTTELHDHLVEIREAIQ